MKTLDKISVEKPNLPFQVVETVNEAKEPENWKNLLIWGDNKLVMSSLIKQGWAGKINLIYINLPFFTDYLKYMYERLILMKELLAKNGTIYIHLNQLTGHPIKKMMEDIMKEIFDDKTRKEVLYFTQKSEFLLNRIILDSSKPGDIVADFFCDSGTTLAVAEKLGRRWIGCDLSKFAIHTARKTLLDIHNSKNLQDNNKQYNKPAKPFNLCNIGNYEKVYWREKQDEYLTFMLKLYQAHPLTGFKYLHGRKGNKAVYISQLNHLVTMEEIEKIVAECKINNFNKVDILVWDWGLLPSLRQLKTFLNGFNLRLLKITDEVVGKDLAKYVNFPEIAYLEIDTKIKGKEIKLKITDFQIAPTEELAKIANKIKDSLELIDYWLIDWNYNGNTFHNQWQNFKTKNNPKIDYEAKHKYKEDGEYQIMVKVVDVFGNDTNKVLKVLINEKKSLTKEEKE